MLRESLTSAVPRAVLVVVILGILAVVVTGPQQSAASLPVYSSAPPAPSSSSPTPTPESATPAAVQQAIAFVAEREGIAVADLAVLDEFPYESAILGRTFQHVSLLHRQTYHVYHVAVDAGSGQAEYMADVRSSEDTILWARCGKLQPALCDRLETMQDNDLVDVAIIVVAKPGERLDDLERIASGVLVAKYPAAAEAVAHGGLPMDVPDRELADQIYQEYLDLMEDKIALRIQPLVEALEGQGFTVHTARGLPAVFATLSKQAILALEGRDDVGTIYLNEIEWQLGLDTAVPTNRAPVVWARGLDGNPGISIAIWEFDAVDFTGDCGGGVSNCFRHVGDTRLPGMEDYHATLVAGCAASEHPVYTGMAPDVTVHSAVFDAASPYDWVEALVWASQKGTDILNSSAYSCSENDPSMTMLDWTFDYYARFYHRLFVVLAGNVNQPQCTPSEIVGSPCKAWNVLTVGGIDNGADADWWNDIWWNGSC